MNTLLSYYNFRQRRLVPQMATYQRMRTYHQSRLYPLVNCQANYMSGVINTDALGFRYSHQQQQCYSVVHANELRVPINLLIGNSLVFGVGASHDKYTLASNLNQLSNSHMPWINFGINHTNSLQELAYFLLHHQQFNQINSFCIVSGIHNLYQHLQSSTSKSCLKQITPTIQQACHATLRDLAVWQRLAMSYQAQLYFFLQPTASWSKQQLTEEEELLSANTLRKYHHANNLKIYHSYSHLLQKQCLQQQIYFCDLNQQLRHNRYWQNNWVFVDNINCNDKGYRFLAKRLLSLL